MGSRGRSEARRTDICLLCTVCVSQLVCVGHSCCFHRVGESREFKAAWLTSPASSISVQFFTGLCVLLHVMAFEIDDRKAVEERASMIWKRKGFKFSLYVF